MSGLCTAGTGARGVPSLGDFEVLVLGDRRSRSVVDGVAAAGCRPLLKDGVDELARMLQGRALSAVVVDCRHTNADALEVVLNVRDVRERIPVYLVERDSHRTDGLSRALALAYEAVEVVRPGELKSALAKGLRSGERERSRGGDRPHEGG